MTTSYIKAEMLVSGEGIISLKTYDGEGRERVYRDITRDIKALAHFVDAINRGDVSLVHIDELVEDFLG